MMALKNHCLFCLERTVPYSVLPKSTSTSINGEEVGVGIIGGELGEEGPPDFQSLCKYLMISLSKRKTGYGASILSSSCDKFLCLCCFEMVERLEELYKELMGIQRRIRKIILDHDISSHLSSTSRMRREEFEKEMESKGSKEEVQKNDCLAFVEMFQTLVKDCADDNMAADIWNVEIGEFKMNVELDEEDRNNCGGEGEGERDPLSTEFHNEMIGSPLEDNSEHPFDTTEMESESRTECDDEVEQKPEIKTELTDKKQDKKRHWQPSAETTSVSSRTRKSLRRSSIPEPSISTSDTEETVPKQQFKCSDCDLLFTSYSKRSEHRKKSHPVKLWTLKSLLATIPVVPHIRKPGWRNGPQNRKRTYICTICGKHVHEKTSTRLPNYMEHMLSHDYDDQQSNPDQEGPHSCTQCDKQFNLKINLDLHVACIHDARQQVIRCNLCKGKVNYGSREALVEHLKSTHGDTVYTCKHCPMAHVSFERLLFHMLKHSKSRRLICPECNAVCGTMSELHEHCLKTHPELKETYNCELCDKVYLEKNTLSNHMEVEHGFDRKSKTFKKSLAVNLECPQCKRKGTIRTYKTQLALRNHIKHTHDMEKNHKCDQCEDKSFGSKSALREHVEIFHEKIRYLCPHCPNSYTRPFALNQHLKTHTKEGLLICEICSKECPSKKRLERHMSSHVTAATGEEWVCKDCGQVFLSRYRLLAHRRNVHTKKSKVCPICGIEVKRLSSLQSHMKRHTGEMPFRHQCPTCNLSFTLKDILNRHLNDVHGMEIEGGN